MIIRKIDVLSAGKIFGVIGVGIGLIAAVLLLLFGGLMSGMMANHAEGALSGMGMGGGLLALVVLPILYGVIGFIGGLIHALIYNLAARLVGGLQIETA